MLTLIKVNVHSPSDTTFDASMVSFCKDYEDLVINVAVREGPERQVVWTELDEIRQVGRVFENDQEIQDHYYVTFRWNEVDK